jgi:hypothetical protein
MTKLFCQAEILKCYCSLMLIVKTVLCYDYFYEQILTYCLIKFHNSDQSSCYDKMCIVEVTVCSLPSVYFR